MRKFRIKFMALLLVLLAVVAFMGFSKVQVKAAGENVGVIAPADVPGWVKGHEDAVKAKFIAAYDANGFTVEPDATVQAIQFEYARVLLIQKFGTEGVIVLNEREGHPLVVKDPVALVELNNLLGAGDPPITDKFLKGVLMDIVVSDGKTYYVTDRRNANGIFEVALNEESEQVAQYLDKRVGVGDGTYADVMWVEYTKAYKLAAQFMSPLGLPTEAVTKHEYTTPDMDNNGTYKLDGEGNKITSLKIYTKQKFENGWIMQAPVRIRKNDGTFGGHQPVQHGAAPILNDMYDLVAGITDNAGFNVTGMPVSLEFNVEGVRYQNFEYGHVKVTGGIAEFVPDLVVDSKGTTMNRRIGISFTWDNIRTGAGGFNHNEYLISWERLRVYQNFRELVGRLIREGRKTSTFTGNGSGQINHSGDSAPAGGVWFSFNDGEGFSLGGANQFLFHTYWYSEAFELAPNMNTGPLVDAKDGLGRPSSDWKEFYNVNYQFFLNGFAYRDLRGNTLNNAPLPVIIIGDEAFNTWLGEYENVEAALLGKGIVSEEHEVKFIGLDGHLLKVEDVAHGSAATPPTPPTLDHYTFDKWEGDYSVVKFPREIQAKYNPINYPINYNLDGGTNHPDNPAEANILSNVLLGAPEKTGLFFMGWFKDAEFTEPITHLKEITSETTIYAKFVEEVTAEDMVGVFAAGSVPDWVKGHETTIKDKFMAAYTLAEFSAIPEQNVKSVHLGKTRVLLYQVIGTEGALFLNEVDGKVIVVKEMAIINQYLASLEDEAQASILLGVVNHNGNIHYVTDKYILYIDGTTPTFLATSIGVGTGLEEFETQGKDFTNEVVLNDFAIAWKFAENFMSSLGVPLGNVEMKPYTTLDVDDNTSKLVEPHTSSAKNYYHQEYENGYILMNRHSHKMQFGAAPILKDFYNLVVAIPDNSDLSKTGTPVSIEMTIEGVRYQNFEYGYVKIVDGAAVFVEELAVDSKGTEVNRRIGSPERFINWHWDPKNTTKYLVGWERLRITQEFRDVVGELIRSGRPPYKTSVTDPYGHNGIEKHTWRAGGSSGLWSILKDGDGPTLGWGNVFILKGYWYNKPYELLPQLNTGDFVDDKQDIGRPIDSWKVLYNARYQVFEGGVGYVDGIEGPVLISGEEFTTWMGTYESVEAAMLGHGVAEAEHTVKWLDHEGNVIKEEQVPHGLAATPPEAPVRDGYIFDGWDPQEYDKIVLPNRVFTATYGIESGQAQSGKTGFINFDSDGETATFWYDDEDQVITVNEQLFEKFRNLKQTMAESIKVSGVPVYADATNLITSLKWFYIDGDEVKVKDTIGTLPADVEALSEIPNDAAIDAKARRIIQDSFADAFAFAFDRSKHQLGLPTKDVEIVKEIPNPANPAVYYDILVQEFSNGHIYQQGYNRAAYPIYGQMLQVWLSTEENGGGGVDGIGIPTSRQFAHEGKIFQSFKYGYIIIEGTNIDVVYEENKQLDLHGNEVDNRFGRWVSRSTASAAHPDFEHEFIRTHEAYLEVHARWTKERNYTFGMIVEANVIAWNGNGASQGFSMSSSTSNQWGQTRFTPIPYKSPHDTPHPVRNGILDTYANLKGNEAGGPGFPLADDFTLPISVTHNEKTVNLEVMYQNFDNGYIRAYIVGDSQESEYFVGYKVDENGKHVNMETGEVEETPPWILRGLDDGPEISKEGLIAKLNELKALRANTYLLEGDLKDLPKNRYYTSQAILDQIDQRIESIEAIVAREDLTQADIEDAINSATAAATLLQNQRQAGQSEDVVEPGATKKMPGWAIALIVISSLAVVGAVVFVLIKFVFIKK